MPMHPAAAEGFSLAAETYVRGRPGYPPETGRWLRETIGLGPGRKALDLGAGTGKFTPCLLATGAEVVAVEPVAEMRAQLSARLPEAPALDGTAEAIPAADGAFDAVVCAQAFHWFATPEAVAEIRRVLRPGGAFGLIWNIRDESTPWVRALTRIFQPYEGDAPRVNSGAWRKVFPAPGFTPLVEQRFPCVHVGPAEEVVLERTLSISFIAALPEDERARVAGKVRELIRETPELSAGDAVAFPYVTHAYSCRLEG